MAKVTSKLQITLPKRLAEQYGIEPGDEIEFVAAGDVIRIVPAERASRPRLSREERERLFEDMIARQRDREGRMTLGPRTSGRRDWRREDLYTRGKPR
jgi:AbrB family looped-hinge helix DNA binding protein